MRNGCMRAGFLYSVYILPCTVASILATVVIALL
mgnify:CR=1 FL=1